MLFPSAQLRCPGVRMYMYVAGVSTEAIDKLFAIAQVT